MRNVLVWLVLDYVCDGVYILDIAVRLHTGAEKMKSGKGNSNFHYHMKIFDRKI